MSIRIDPKADALGIIDVQPTFMPKGGLPVAGGDEVVVPINRLQKAFRVRFATRDAHPAGHKSFASAHGVAPYSLVSMPYGPQVSWPDHGIDGTAEAELHPDLDKAGLALILSKGMDPEIDSYSAFFENDRTTPTGLDGWLRSRGIRRIFLCGLATDFCVGFSAEDAIRAGFEAAIVEDACRAVDLDGSACASKTRLIALGVRFVSCADVLGA